MTESHPARHDGHVRRTLLALLGVLLATGPLGGQEATYWVRREGPHHTVRNETQLPPAAGGATVTMELTSVEAPGGS